MRKQTSSTSSTLLDHPNASKRIPFFLHTGINQAPPPPPPSSNPPPSLPNGTGNGNINGNNHINPNNGNGMSNEDPVANYTLQGVMQWLNGEYRRYERERNAWEIEKASLLAQVSHLMGTKVGTQKVQDDLMRQNRILERKIKALEFALKAERAKNSGKEIKEEVDDDVKGSPTPSTTSQAIENVDTDITPLLTHPDRQRSRKLLESCLREINYLMTPPSIPIDQNINQEWPQQQPQFPAPPREPPRKQPPAPQQQLQQEDQVKSEEISYVPVDNESSRQQEEEELPRKLPKKVNLATDTPPLNIAKKEDVSWDFTPHPLDTTTILERPAQQRHSAQNLFDNNIPVVRKPRLFNHIHTLRSHLSPIRALIACNSAVTLPDETCFISGGDDSTIKFWRVNRAGTTTKKKGNFDVLPKITFRGHTGMVTCLAESLGNIWSGGSDGGIRGWKVPSATRDAYGSSMDAAAASVLEGHTNCIWSLAVPGTQQPLLASAAADGTVKIWDTRLHSRSPLRASFKYPEEEGKVNPTSVSWDWEGRGIIIGWGNASVELWDVDRGAPTMKLISTDAAGAALAFLANLDTGKSAQVNCFVKHPQERLVIAGYEDRNIRIFDTRIGDCINSWNAHLESISSLAISPDGSTLLSGAHDASVRFWDLSDKTCLQEALPPHRQRGDEGVLAVAWGDDEVAGSAGADGIIKLYVEQ